MFNHPYPILTLSESLGLFPGSHLNITITNTQHGKRPDASICPIWGEGAWLKAPIAIKSLPGYLSFNCPIKFAMLGIQMISIDESCLGDCFYSKLCDQIALVGTFRGEDFNTENKTRTHAYSR